MILICNQELRTTFLEKNGLLMACGLHETLRMKLQFEDQFSTQSGHCQLL